jgi:hypothetical protein
MSTRSAMGCACGGVRGRHHPDLSPSLPANNASFCVDGSVAVLCSLNTRGTIQYVTTKASRSGRLRSDVP